jgi:hypothetical protein
MSIRDVDLSRRMFVGSDWATLWIVQVTALKRKAAAFAMSVSTPKRSHHSDPRLIEPRYIASHKFEDFRGVGALWT